MPWLTFLVVNFIISIKMKGMFSMNKVLYWVFTAPFVLLMLGSSMAYLMELPQIVEGMHHLGFPPYIVKILGTAKLLGVLAILLNRFRTLKEWAYAGFTINILGASASHFFSGDTLMQSLMPLVFLILLLASYFYWKKNEVPQLAHSL